MSNESFKIKRVSASDQVSERMKDFILREEWKAYQKIPSESELAEMFGVNRLTVRMALQKLNTIGILETRVGDGTYVKPFSFYNHIKNISEFYMRPELLEDVCEFRTLIEVECARLAIDRATADELDELKARCVRYEEYLAITWPIYGEQTIEQKKEIVNQMAELDLDIHHYICEMSHNALFAYAFSVAHESIYQYLTVIIKKRFDRWVEKGIDMPQHLHSDIHHTIVEKDFHSCKRIYTEMVDHKFELEI